jgi:glycosyltransferase involved in cell wall biosynthesis
MSRRIAILASEILGMQGTGGAATADSLLAVALARHGHDVEVLVAPGREHRPLAEEWARIYADAGVRIRPLANRLKVRPRYLAPAAEMLAALRDQPPDVVIADDWRGLGWAALRTRQLGRGLEKTAFVVHCHGPARVLAAFAQKVPDTLARFGDEIAERTAIGLADAVVSPSEWLLDWMREHGWPVPESAQVIQYVRQSVALDDAPTLAQTGIPIRRLAFFGQLREGKGIRLYLEALGALEPELLAGVELLFLGRETPRWTAERILDSLSTSVKNRVAAIRFETGLERADAIAELTQPGTLAVLPSLLDNSPNTVSECLEHGVPFVATTTGGIPELVAAEDRDRVLCEPTSSALARTLERVLRDPASAVARLARDPRDSLVAWLELVDSVRAGPRRAVQPAQAVTIVARGEHSAARARRLAEVSRLAGVDVVAAASRDDGLECVSADWVLFLDDEDAPEDTMIDMLVSAQAASAADVVTAGVRPADDPDGIQLFLGDPGSLGLVENQYGVVGLVRRSLLRRGVPDGVVDSDWPLFAQLALDGAHVVSLPEAVSTHSGRVGSVSDVPGEGLVVLEAYEQSASSQLTDLPHLAATLAAARARLDGSDRASSGIEKRGVVRRGVAILRDEGLRGLARRGRTRLGAVRPHGHGSSGR